MATPIETEEEKKKRLETEAAAINPLQLNTTNFNSLTSSYKPPTSDLIIPSSKNNPQFFSTGTQTGLTNDIKVITPEKKATEEVPSKREGESSFNLNTGKWETYKTPQKKEEKSYSVVFPYNEKANMVFNDKKEAEDYFESMGGIVSKDSLGKSPGGTPGGIISTFGKDSQKRAENVAYGNPLVEEKGIRKFEPSKDFYKLNAPTEEERNRTAKFRADVAARRSALDAYNNYNNDMSLLNRAYREAKSKKDFGTAFAIKQQMNRESVGVPQEEGAKQKFFEGGQFAERELMRQQEANRLQEEEDNRRRLVASNPFAANYGFNRL